MPFYFKVKIPGRITNRAITTSQTFFFVDADFDPALLFPQANEDSSLLGIHQGVVFQDLQGFRFPYSNKFLEFSKSKSPTLEVLG